MRTAGNRLIDPRMRTSIPYHWPSRCTILSLNTTLDTANQPIPGTPLALPGLVNLECRMAPFILIRPNDAEVRDHSITEDVNRRNLKINGFYPQILPTYNLASVDGVVYRIMGVEADGSSFSTRLHLEIIKP